MRVIEGEFVVARVDLVCWSCSELGCMWLEKPKNARACRLASAINKSS